MQEVGQGRDGLINLLDLPLAFFWAALRAACSCFSLFLASANSFFMLSMLSSLEPAALSALSALWLFLVGRPISSESVSSLE